MAILHPRTTMYSMRLEQYFLWPVFQWELAPGSLWEGGQAAVVPWLSPVSEWLRLHLQINIKDGVPHWWVDSNLSQVVTQQENRIRKTRESACLWWAWHMGSRGISETTSAWEHFLCQPSPPSSGLWGPTLERDACSCHASDGSPWQTGWSQHVSNMLSPDLGTFADIIFLLQSLQGIWLNRHPFIPLFTHPINS